jgi:hypothetical protein
MFGWIDRRLRQATGLTAIPFGGISIVLVGDIAQLPPVGDKVLYHNKPGSYLETAYTANTANYCIYCKLLHILQISNSCKVRS